MVQFIGGEPTLYPHLPELMDRALGRAVAVEVFSNLVHVTAPGLALLDWESWGRKMAGYDAASLYVLSLGAPDTARTLHETFADVLECPDGRRAQLFAITRYLRRVEIGEFHDLADTWHAHARTLVDRARRPWQ